MPRWGARFGEATASRHFRRFRGICRTWRKPAFWIGSIGRISTATPATPLLVAGVLLFTENAERAAIVQSGVWYLLSIPLVYLLARRFTKTAVGVVCALLYLADPHLRTVSYAGMTQTLAMFLTAVFFLIISRPRVAAWHWVCLGGVCGLAYLTRTQMVVLLPIGLGCAWCASQEGNRRKVLALVLVGAVVAASPWLVRNTVLTGSPTFSLSTSRNLLRRSTAYDYEVEKDLHTPVRAGEVVSAHGGAIAAKIGGNLAQIVRPAFWQAMFGTGSAVAIALLVLLYLGRVVSRRLRDEDSQYTRFKCGTLVLAALTFLVVCVAFHEPDFYHPLRPFILVLICTECWNLLSSPRALGKSRLAKVVALTLAVLAATGGVFATTRTEAIARNRVAAATDVEQETYEQLATIVAPDAVVVASTSPRVALYADRRSIRLPHDPAQLLEIADRYVDYEYILLTRSRGLTAADEWAYAASPEYAEFLRSSAFRARFRQIARLPNGGVLFQKR